MIQRIFMGLVAVAVAACSFAQDTGDEPPLRLKRKGTPAAASKDRPGQADPAQEKKPDRPAAEPRDDPVDPDTAVPERDEQELLGRIDRNMRTSEDRLANRELTDATRQVQEDILKDLDALINKDQNNPQDQPNQQDQQADSRSGQDRKPQAGSRSLRGNRSQMRLGSVRRS